MEKPVLEINHIEKAYGDHKVLDDILTNWKQDYYKYTAR